MDYLGVFWTDTANVHYTDTYVDVHTKKLVNRTCLM